ncbi:MAG: type I glyceraldehyde-3-phosphate dehydrogenase [Alphaproteobacteria bacterium]|jgi:glyceraldehyde 3-phosphate dehydrogenase|nr:type I glyceraldehyde-3-phosphate dehydrogenase [Alphaproteobacteria bacterium]
MTIRVAINGFGRIGRLTLRALIENKRSDIEVVAVNDLGSAATNAHLLKYDSVHGILNADVSVKDENTFLVNGKEIVVTAERDPKNLPWGKLNVDVVYECTGIFTARDKAAAHIAAGAKKVIISAPANDSDLTVVYGVNHGKLTASHEIISNASCTTNCLAPVVHALHKSLGVVKGFCTTIHSYTGDQPTLDTYHKDLRRARAAALSMIPTTTGAAKAVGLVLPELKGKLNGSSVRVPTPNVSLVDFKFISAKPTTAEEVNKILTEASKGELKGILGVEAAPLVSHDFNHNPLSSIVDLSETNVTEGDFVRVISWYDNEWGFSNRMSDTAVALMKAGK